MRMRSRSCSLAGVLALTSSVIGIATAAQPATAAVPAVQVAYAVPVGPGSAYAADSSIRVIGLDGSVDHAVSTEEAAAEPAWNPSGTLLAFTALLPGGVTAVHVIDPSTGAERAVTPAGWRTPVWSPDGSQLAVESGAGAQAGLGVVAAEGGDPTVLIAPSDHGGDDAVTGEPAWSPDGSQLAAVLTEYIGGVATDDYLAVLGADHPGYSIIALEYGPPSPAHRQVVWTAGGDIVFDLNAGRTPDLGRITPNGLGQHSIASGVADLGGYSPDGSTLLAALDGTIVGFTGGATKRVVRVPPAGAADSHPVYSASGTQIVFCETTSSGSDLWAMGSDGSGVRRLTSSGRACDPTVASRAPRFAGPNRDDTAVSVSRSTYGSAPSVVIARDDLYPDALAAAPLAAKVGGPLLLTPPSALPMSVRIEIGRLGARTAYVIGDTTAVSAQVDGDLRAAGITTIVRIGGPTRYETAALIAQRVGGTEVYVVRGDNWPDAAAASALAAFQHRALLLTTQDFFPMVDYQALLYMNATQATIVGGAAAVSSNVEKQLAEEGIATTRLAGADRWATSAVVASAEVAAGMTSSDWLADGLNWPDAVGAGPAAAVARGALLLVAPAARDGSPATRDWLRAHPAPFVVAVGGPDVVSPSDIAGALG